MGGRIQYVYDSSESFSKLCCGATETVRLVERWEKGPHSFYSFYAF